MLFRRKPVIVPGFRFGYMEAPEWFTKAVNSVDEPSRVTTYPLGVSYVQILDGKRGFCIINNGAEVHRCNFGDWILQSADGILYTLTDAVLHTFYEELPYKNQNKEEVTK